MLIILDLMKENQRVNIYIHNVQLMAHIMVQLYFGLLIINSGMAVWHAKGI